MNRLKEFFEQPPEPEREKDFYEMESYYDTYAVSRETAATVYRISESTAAQCAAGRAFNRARRLEAKADRRPREEDDRGTLALGKLMKP